MRPLLSQQTHQQILVMLPCSAPPESSWISAVQPLPSTTYAFLLSDFLLSLNEAAPKYSAFLISKLYLVVLSLRLSACVLLPQHDYEELPCTSI